MDLSALIFVALAVAWAVYLIPQALKHHENSAATRNVEGFSSRLRVLARREPVDSRTARLVVEGRSAEAEPSGSSSSSSSRSSVKVGETPAAPVGAAHLAARRAAAKRATGRRRRVLGAILAALVGVTGVAIAGVISGWFVVLPVAVLAAWLVACRLMVRREIAELPQRVVAPSSLDEDAVGETTEEIAAVVDVADTESTEATPGEPSDGVSPPPPAGGWDPVPVTLPTYVGKEPAARRRVRTIDLDSTGVWTSGRSAADSQLARDAEEADQAARAQARAAAARDERRASGS
ncbi:hypothetical protein [Nocardioides sp. R-C-SC26]|uniref:divisome protein SepX/GlpR n=1 Tax=Nocardioides sp. R-C-SC26 TaxID=2870414 RepID=UPI001E3B306F|nr:hypothetical protein [Nocardioides sp. R-C-SC26]